MDNLRSYFMTLYKNESQGSGDKVLSNLFDVRGPGFSSKLITTDDFKLVPKGFMVMNFADDTHLNILELPFVMEKADYVKTNGNRITVMFDTDNESYKIFILHFTKLLVNQCYEDKRNNQKVDLKYFDMIRVDYDEQSVVIEMRMRGPNNTQEVLNFVTKGLIAPDSECDHLIHFSKFYEIDQQNSKYTVLCTSVKDEKFEYANMIEKALCGEMEYQVNTIKHELEQSRRNMTSRLLTYQEVEVAINQNRYVDGLGLGFEASRGKAIDFNLFVDDETDYVTGYIYLGNDVWRLATIPESYIEKYILLEGIVVGINPNINFMKHLVPRDIQELDQCLEDYKAKFKECSNNSLNPKRVIDICEQIMKEGNII